MQVADIQGDATAATLGAQKTVAVTMVQDASFLMMLASNLYSNQKLAVVREVLCNAWDAHIESGMTQVPVKVTITADNELIIEDSGYGIPADMFPEVYGTMGGSTKRKNVAVTGGFGLGAKSPWSYVDSFRVINENQGTKTVYNLVRASVEADGKPAIQQVMQVPTERSGLTVRFQLQEQDVREIVLYIRSITCHGDMLVDFDNQTQRDPIGGPLPVERLKTIGMSAAPGSYDVDSAKWHQYYMGNHKVFVRYGAVIYPMLDTPGTKKALDLLREFMEVVGYQKMVVQAAPGTLALTPNREALSSSKMTEDGLTDLCVDLVAKLEADILRQIPGSMDQAIKTLLKGSSSYQSLDERRSLFSVISPYSVQKYLSSPLGNAMWAKYRRALEEAERAGFKRSHVFHNKAATREYHKLRTRLGATTWQKRDGLMQAFKQHFILRPVSRIFQQHKDLLSFSQFHHVSEFTNSSRSPRRKLMPYVHVQNFEEVKQLIDSPTVFITSRSRKVKESIDACPDIPADAKHAVWVYKIETKDKKKDEIIKAFTDSGMHVIDLTLNHDWDDAAAEIQAEYEARYAAKKKAILINAAGPSVKKKTGNALMSLSNVYDEEGVRKMDIGSIKLMKADLETSDTPLFYIEAECVSSSGSLGQFGHYILLTEDERKHGVIVRNGIEKNMAIKRGAVTADKYFAKKLWDMVHQPELTEYRTKLRFNSLQEQFHVPTRHVEFLQYVGIKLPGYDKLKTDRVMEVLCDKVDSLSCTDFSWQLGLSFEDLEPFVAIKQQKLEEPVFVKMVQTIREDEMLGRFLSMLSDMEMLQKFPDRKSALKSLVMSALKNGTTTNE